MNGFIPFLKKFRLAGLLFASWAGAAGSVLGAARESKIHVGIIEKIPEAGAAPGSVPSMTGLFELASSQNLWVSYRYAAAFFAGGVILFLLLAAILYRLKDKRPVAAFLSFFDFSSAFGSARM